MFSQINLIHMELCEISLSSNQSLSNYSDDNFAGICNLIEIWLMGRHANYNLADQVEICYRGHLYQRPENNIDNFFEVSWCLWMWNNHNELPLTHYGLVMPYNDTELDHHWLR